MLLLLAALIPSAGIAEPCDTYFCNLSDGNATLVVDHLYSDGLTEAMDHKGEQYGLDRFRAQLQRLWGTGSLRAACEAVFQDVAKFETQNRDDRTLLILGRDAS